MKQSGARLWPVVALLAAAAALVLVVVWHFIPWERLGVTPGGNDAALRGGFLPQVRTADGAVGAQLPPPQWLRTAQPKQTVVGFLPDGTLLTALDGQKMVLWNTTTLKEIRRIPARYNYMAEIIGVHPFCLAPDGRTLAVLDGIVRTKVSRVQLWDVPSGKPRRLLDGLETVNSLAFSPDGHTLATFESCMIWADRKLFANTPMGTMDWLDASRQRGQIQLWDVNSAAPPKVMRFNSAMTQDTATINLNNAVYAPSGNRVAMNIEFRGPHEPGLTKPVIYNLTTGQVERMVAATPNLANGTICYAPDGASVAISAGKMVAVCNSRTGAIKYKIDCTTKAGEMCFSPDSSLLFVSEDCGPTTVWDARTSQAKFTIPTSSIGRIAISPDGKTLAATSKQQVQLWRVG